MTLLETVRADLREAMKAKDRLVVATLRSVVAAVQEAEVAGSAARELDDAEVEKVISAQAKRRVEAADAFDQGGRADRAAAEREELAVLERYLPERLSDDDLAALVDRVLAEGGFTAMSDMGPAMKAVNAEVAGRAEGRTVADLVKGRLGS